MLFINSVDFVNSLFLTITCILHVTLVCPTFELTNSKYAEKNYSWGINTHKKGLKFWE